MKNSNRVYKSLKDKKGSVLPLIGLAFGVLVLSAGFTIDYTRALIVKERLQWAVDAAALAGAKVARDGLEAVQREADQYFEANFPTGYMGTSGGNLVASSIDAESPNGKGFRFELEGMTMETYLVDAVGFSDIGVGVAAEVNTLPITPMDVVFSLDLSGSMMVTAGEHCVTLPYAADCFAGTSKLDKAKEVMVEMVENLHPGNDKVRFGLVGWSSFVNINGVIGGAYTTHGCDGGNNVAYVASENPVEVGEGNADSPPMHNNCYEYIPGTIPGSGSLRPMLYLTSTEQTILNAINAQKAEANTDGALGMHWAYAMLELRNKGWLNWRDAARNKSIVLLTDGNNTRFYRDPGEVDSAEDGPKANTLEKHWCDMADAADINIYTIAYDIPDDAGGPRSKGKAVLEYCASNVCPDNPGSKCYFDAESDGELEKAMKYIATTMMTMRLTK